MVSTLYSSQIQEVSEAFLVPITEAEFARECREEGLRVICHQGRYWTETKVPGVYQPIHLMSRLKLEEVTPPTPLCWAFRSALHENDISYANGSIPVHLLSDPASYDLHCLSSNRRSQIRRCYKQVKIVQLVGPTLLEEQGYEVLCSSLERTNYYIKLPSKESYLANITTYTTDKHRIMIAGLIDEKLAGYCYGIGIDGTAYLEYIHMTTEALTTNISSGLTFEFVRACSRSGKIRELVHSPHIPENPGLIVYKEGMGFPVRHIPAKVEINPVMETFVRWKYPYKYYRFTGRY
ncbi:hypothetical protein [Chlorogloeopsis sp. ULAP02]|uniref:hypothetical protein n=1 Tax=Chlorogloeopsis sp. ULAP02 TaxID=3107926 RepID=UPI003136F22F